MDLFVENSSLGENYVVRRWAENSEPSQMTKMTPLDIWKTEFTPEIIALAKYRILDGGSLATRRDLPKYSVKLALILVRILNPPEELSEAETAILMGVTSPTLKKMREEKKFIQVVNR
jgi:hypothetical protein